MPLITSGIVGPSARQLDMQTQQNMSQSLQGFGDSLAQLGAFKENQFQDDAQNAMKMFIDTKPANMDLQTYLRMPGAKQAAMTYMGNIFRGNPEAKAYQADQLLTGLADSLVSPESERQFLQSLYGAGYLETQPQQQAPQEVVPPVVPVVPGPGPGPENKNTQGTPPVATGKGSWGAALGGVQQENVELPTPNNTTMLLGSNVGGATTFEGAANVLKSAETDALDRKYPPGSLSTNPLDTIDKQLQDAAGVVATAEKVIAEAEARITGNSARDAKTLSLIKRQQAIIAEATKTAKDLVLAKKTFIAKNAPQQSPRTPQATSGVARQEPSTPSTPAPSPTPQELQNGTMALPMNAGNQMILENQRRAQIASQLRSQYAPAPAVNNTPQGPNMVDLSGAIPSRVGNTQGTILPIPVDPNQILTEQRNAQIVAENAQREQEALAAEEERQRLLGFQASPRSMSSAGRQEPVVQDRQATPEMGTMAPSTESSRDLALQRRETAAREEERIAQERRSRFSPMVYSNPNGENTDNPQGKSFNQERMTQAFANLDRGLPTDKREFKAVTDDVITDVRKTMKGKTWKASELGTEVMDPKYMRRAIASLDVLAPNSNVQDNPMFSALFLDTAKAEYAGKLAQNRALLAKAGLDEKQTALMEQSVKQAKAQTDVDLLKAQNEKVKTFLDGSKPYLDSFYKQTEDLTKGEADPVKRSDMVIKYTMQQREKNPEFRSIFDAYKSVLSQTLGTDEEVARFLWTSRFGPLEVGQESMTVPVVGSTSKVNQTPGVASTPKEQALVSKFSQ